MRIISDTDIQTLNISAKKCVEWVKEVFLFKSECQLPPKISLHPQGTDFINTMPCILPDNYGVFGCKIVSRIKGSNPSLKSKLILIDSKNGEWISLIDCNWITAMRTGAVAALAINTFQNSKAKIYSFIGLGVIGHATLDCFFETINYKDKIIRFKKYKDHAEKTIEKYTKLYPDARFEICNTNEDLVRDADVIVSCITEAKEFLINDISLFKPGVLIVPVHTKGFQNCDTEFEKVFADDEGHIKGFQYFNDFRKFGEFADVLSFKTMGREDEKERILSYNIGLGIFDVFFGYQINNLIKNNVLI